MRATLLMRRSVGMILRLLGVPRLPLARWIAREALRQWEQYPDARAALKEALIFHGELYRTLGRLAARAEGGEHPKHRLTRYHEFFLAHIGPEDSVLDVGCGEGFLTREITRATRGRVLGIERDPVLLQRALAVKNPPNLSYICADATTWHPRERFDVIVLSNLLEHLDDRVRFLRNLVAEAQPRAVLVRVPMVERDWLVPLKQELGLDHRLDPDHRLEYVHSVLREELEAAGLIIKELHVRFGEYLCLSVPR